MTNNTQSCCPYTLAQWKAPKIYSDPTGRETSRHLVSVSIHVHTYSDLDIENQSVTRPASLDRCHIYMTTMHLLRFCV